MSDPGNVGSWEHRTHTVCRTEWTQEPLPCAHSFMSLSSHGLSEGNRHTVHRRTERDIKNRRRKSVNVLKVEEDCIWRGRKTTYANCLYYSNWAGEVRG